MAAGGKRKSKKISNKISNKKPRKITATARKLTRPKKAAKSPARKKTKAAPRRKTRSAAKAMMPPMDQIAPSGEPEFVSNAPPVKF